MPAPFIAGALMLVGGTVVGKLLSSATPSIVVTKREVDHYNYKMRTERMFALGINPVRDKVLDDENWKGMQAKALAAGVPLPERPKVPVTEELCLFELEKSELIQPLWALAHQWCLTKEEYIQLRGYIRRYELDGEKGFYGNKLHTLCREKGLAYKDLAFLWQTPPEVNGHYGVTIAVLEQYSNARLADAELMAKVEREMALAAKR